MASYQDQATYAATQGFQARTGQAATAAALFILANDPQNQPSKQARARFANTYLNSPTAYIPAMAAAAVNDTTVSSKIAAGGATGTDTDADLLNAVKGIWTAFSQNY
jgi:hypothetical protein